MANVITNSYRDNFIKDFNHNSDNLVIRGTFFRFSVSGFIPKYTTIADLSIDDINQYKGDNDMYDGNAFVYDWRENHKNVRDFDRYIKNIDTVNYINVLNLIFNCNSVVEEYVNGNTMGTKGGRPKKVIWIHKLLFIRLAEKMDNLLGLKVMSLLIDFNEIDFIRKRISDGCLNYRLQRGKDNIKTYIAIDTSNKKIAKIGKSHDLKKREDGMRCANPHIFIIYYVEKDIEDILHNEFENKLYRGEWYFLTKEDINDIVNRYKFNRYAEYRKCSFFDKE